LNWQLSCALRRPKPRTGFSRKSSCGILTGTPWLRVNSRGGRRHGVRSPKTDRGERPAPEVERGRWRGRMGEGDRLGGVGKVQLVLRRSLSWMDSGAMKMNVFERVAFAIEI
jgi:hypothetical protein